MRRLWLLLVLAFACPPASGQQPSRWVVKTRAGNYELRTGALAAQGGDNQIIEREIVYQSSDQSIQVVPNDPFYLNQWGLSPAGINWLGARDAGADGSGVTVAVVDTGVRRDVPDLAGTQILPGTDIINADSDPTDDNGHGTHVTGTIAQTTDNNYGCVGIAPKAMILPVKVLDARGSGSNYTVAQGIRWASDHGANVINLSLGGGASLILQDAVRYAVSRGVVVVAAAGNGGTRGLASPAAYPEVISVGAIDSGGQRANFSQYGPELTLSAPGVGILQQTFDPARGQFYFGSWSGTSMATPHVSGVCVLLHQKDPSLTPAQIKDRLTRTARDLGAAGRDDFYGAGCVDATAAVAGLGTNPTPPPTPVPTPTPAPMPDSWATEILRLVNAARVANGVKPLVLQSQLTSAAQGWSDYMARNHTFSHFAPDGSGPGERIAATGYRFRTWGENIAWGYRTPQAVMDAWMASAGHKRNILYPAFTELGLGRTPDASGAYYWVQDFGAR